ncbi:MAG: hypothetical protein ACJAYU_003189 [Bradymonadia bacterium]
MWAPEAAAQDTTEEVSAAQDTTEEDTTEEVAEPTAGYRSGFFIRSNDEPFDLRINGRVQARYQHVATEGEDTNEGAFSIPRARLTFSGHAFADELSYKFELDFGKGTFATKDFYLDYAFNPNIRLRIGQYKLPFSRQQLNSSGRLDFVDRSITNRSFGAGRDIGIMVHNGYTSSPEFEYGFGVFNGTGDKGRFSGAVNDEGEVSGSFSNVPDVLNPTLALRLGYNYGGIRGYREADLEGGGFRAAVGMSAIADFDSMAGEEGGVAAELDYMVKVEGFSTSGGVYIATVQDGESFGDQAVDTIGAHVQASYMITDTIQPAVRFATVAPEGDDNNSTEILGGISAYFFGHGLKWQTDAGAIISEGDGGSTSEVVVRSQLQLSF